MTRPGGRRHWSGRTHWSLRPGSSIGVGDIAYADERVVLYVGDCRQVLPQLDVGHVDAVITDPPYGETSLVWDERVEGWLELAAELVDEGHLWCFGSLRLFMETAPAFKAAGWRYAQELVWEKHNGPGFSRDRFRRVHELVCGFYRGKWTDLRREVPRELAPVSGGPRRRARMIPGVETHTGVRAASVYEEDLRYARSVIRVQSCHGRAIAPTQKPFGILRPLVEYSVPPGGLVVDPFAGSGSTLAMARDSGRRAIGVEIDPEQAERAAGMLGQLSLFGGG